MNSPCLTVPLPRSIRKIPFFSLAGIKGRARGRIDRFYVIFFWNVSMWALVWVIDKLFQIMRFSGRIAGSYV